MAKGTGLIGNFKGKVGNTVGYKLTASNNGQTQGIRVYQPIVKNPKTAAQAEQRAKLLAVNATYRALKMVIDRGNEGLPYGNKSRLAWLKGALTAEQMPWIEKGKAVTAPVGCQLTKGGLNSIDYSSTDDQINVILPGVTSSSTITTVGELSTALLAGYRTLKNGDQITFVFLGTNAAGMKSEVVSIIIDPTSSIALNTLFVGVEPANNAVSFEGNAAADAVCVIVSRLGDGGEHLRSSETLKFATGITSAAPYDADSKAAAIASYQSTGYINADWQEESIQ